MRPLALLAACALATVACTSGMSANMQEGSPTSVPPPVAPLSPSAVPAASASEGPAAPTTASAAAPSAGAALPDCKSVPPRTVNELPDGGVVMSNANVDAGASTRTQPLIDLMRAHADGFRCCFDLWARDHAGAEGDVTLTVTLGPTGALEAAGVDEKRSTVNAPEVARCFADLAHSLTYPASPSGKQTTFSHRFSFKARR